MANGGPYVFLPPQEPNGGSPNHPDPPAGHAFTAGVGVTLLKAFFAVGTPSNPRPWPVPAVEASPDGLSLLNTGDNPPLLAEPTNPALNLPHSPHCPSFTPP